MLHDGRQCLLDFRKLHGTCIYWTGWSECWLRLRLEIADAAPASVVMLPRHLLESSFRVSICWMRRATRLVSWSVFKSIIADVEGVLLILSNISNVVR